MLRTYIDASRKGSVMCLAGYMADPTAWRRFQTQWKRVLHKADPMLPYFHTADYMSRTAKPYSTWAEDKRRAVLRALVDTVCENMKAGFFVSLDQQAYRELTADQRRRIGTEYSLAATAFIGGVRRLLNEVASLEQVAYVFELGDLGAGQFNATINALMADSTYKEAFGVLSVHMEDKRNAVGLQAADLLAWVMSLAAGRNVIPGDPELRRLVEERGTGFGIVDKEEMERLATLTDEERARLLRAFSVPPVRRQQRKRS